MGAVSSCCSVEPAKEGRETLKPGDEKAAAAERSAQASTEMPPQPPATVIQKTDGGGSDLEEFQARLEQSIDMIVVIADGKRIPCKLRWTAADQGLVMSCDVNNHLHIRRIALDELVAVIAGRKELARVATRANIVDDPTCVALHLASNTCIPICLQTMRDKQNFVEFMKKVKRS